MLRANLIQIFLTDYSYENRVDFFKGLNHSLVLLSDEELTFSKEKINLKFTLNYLEEDVFTKTFLSEFEDGAPFRVIRPIGVSKEISVLQYNAKDVFSAGSTNPDGYSVSFILTDENDIRNNEIVVKGIEEQLQNLVAGAMMALQNNLQNDFYNISRRLISSIKRSDKDIHQIPNGSMLARILRDTSHQYDEIEQRIIASWF